MNTALEMTVTNTTPARAIHPDVFRTIRDLFSGKDMETMQVLLPFVENYVANPTVAEDLNYTLSNYMKLCELDETHRGRVAKMIVKKLKSDLRLAWGRFEKGKSGVTKTEIFFTPQGFWTAFDYGNSPFAVKVRSLKNKIFNLAMTNIAKRSLNYEAKIDFLQLKNEHTNAELEDTNAELEDTNADLQEANADLQELNNVWVETNQQLQESNRILELGISNIIVDTLNLPTNRGKLTAVGVQRLIRTIGRLSAARIIEKRGQFSNWVLRNHMDIDVLRNHIRG